MTRLQLNSCRAEHDEDLWRTASQQLHLNRGHVFHVNITHALLLLLFTVNITINLENTAAAAASIVSSFCQLNFKAALFCISVRFLCNQHAA